MRFVLISAAVADASVAVDDVDIPAVTRSSSLPLLLITVRFTTAISSNQFQLDMCFCISAKLLIAVSLNARSFVLIVLETLLRLSFRCNVSCKIGSDKIFLLHIDIIAVD